MEKISDLAEYLGGEKFSKSLICSLEKKPLEGIGREDVIAGMVRGKSVLHIGCTDHIPLIREKITNNKWLHKIITENSSACLGIDIDRESVEFVRNEIGFSNVIAGDLMKDDLSEISEGNWDYVVFGEIIEHLDNPVEFLKTFRDRFGKKVKNFIITVPNVLTSVNYRNMLKYREVINSDHRYWFTPYTISRVLVAAGYNPQIISYANLNPLGFKRLAIRKLYRLAGIKYRYPFYCFKSLVITGSL